MKILLAWNLKKKCVNILMGNFLRYIMKVLQLTVHLIRERGDFVDQNHFQEAVADVEKAKVTAEKAVKDIEKKKSRTENEPDSVVGQVIAHIEKERKKQETAKVEKTIKKSKQPTLAKRRVDITLPTYNRSERKLISKIFGIIVSATDEKTAEKIIRKIEDELQ